jgi:hypothetical protein
VSLKGNVFGLTVELFLKFGRRRWRLPHHYYHVFTNICRSDGQASLVCLNYTLAGEVRVCLPDE